MRTGTSLLVARCSFAGSAVCSTRGPRRACDASNSVAGPSRWSCEERFEPPPAASIYACRLRVLHHPDIWNRQTAGVSGKLIVSVSGIGERTLADVDAFCRQMDSRNVPVSLLVAPRLSGDYRLDHDPRPVEWLGNRRAGGAS